MEVIPGRALSQAYLTRANVLYHLGDPASTADYCKAFALDPAETAQTLVAMLAAQLHVDADAVFADCERHLRENPRDSLSYGRRGISLLLQGKEAEALWNIDQANRLNNSTKAIREWMMRIIKERSTLEPERTKLVQVETNQE